MARKEEDLVEEHLQITALARRMKNAQSRDVLLRLLPEFCAALERHFAAEEEPEGFFDVLRKNAPQRQRQVDGLVQQHRNMLRVAQALAEVAQAEGVETDAEIIEQAHQIADVLVEHEAAENALLLDAFNTDIGASD